MSNNWLVEQIDQEIAKLQQAKQLLIEVERKDGRVATKPASHKRRTMSAEAKARIAAAQKARWAKQRKTASKKAAA